MEVFLCHSSSNLKFINMYQAFDEMMGEVSLIENLVHINKLATAELVTREHFYDSLGER